MFPGVPRSVGVPSGGASPWQENRVVGMWAHTSNGNFISRLQRRRPWGREESDTTWRLNKLRKVHISLFSVRLQGLKADPNFVDGGREGQV